MKHFYALQKNIRFAISRWQVILYDGLMVVIAWFLAYWFRFNLDVIPQPFFDQAITLLPLVVLIHVGMFIGFGVHRGAWQFTSTPDIVAIVKSVFFGTALVAVAIFVAVRLEGVPRSVFPSHSVLLMGLLITNRLLYRAYHARAGRRVLVIGAGVAGDMLVRDLSNSNPVLYEPIAYLDDDPYKKGRHIQGLWVVGACSELPKVVQELRIDLVLLALPNATTQDMRRIVNYCEEAQVSYRTLPNVHCVPALDLLEAARSRNVRPVTLDDLLGRDETNQDNPI
jgi:FlaA1/EpsC-like NDP-sugar epimerase